MAYWDFEESSGSQVQDRSGNGHHGSISGTVMRGGTGGRALYFNGTTMVTAPYNASYNLNEFTLAAWVKMDTVGFSSVCIISRQPPVGTPWNYRLLISGGDLVNSRWRPAIGTPIVDYWDGGAYDSSNVYGSNIVGSRAWHHLTGTYRNRELRIYLDGVLIGTHGGISATPVLSSTEPIVLGGSRYSSNPYRLQGWMDETRIYNVALSAAQVDTLYRGFTPPVVVNSPPPAPVLSTPVNGAVGQPPSLTLSWNAVSGAASYGLQMADDSLFTTSLINYTGITAMSRAVTGLGLGLHYWRVNAANGNGTGAWSTVWRFTVGPPAAPTLLTPSNGSAQGPSPTLTWTAVSGATSYGLQMADDPGFSLGLQNFSGITGTSRAFSGLALGVHYWRINATHSAGTGNWSAVFSFTVSTPPAPSLSSPANGATGLFPSLTLIWNSAVFAASYGLQMATDSFFNAPAVNLTGLTATSRAVNLSNGTRYFWRANAANSAGTSPWSAVRAFTTASPPVVPPLVAYWDFEERSGVQVLDKSGNNHHGTIQGAVYWGGTGGTALGFNGATKVTVPYDSQLSLDRFTLMTWVWPQNTTGFSQCLICRQPPAGSPFNYRLFMTGQDLVNSKWRSAVGTPVLDYWDGGAYDSCNVFGSATVGFGNWHMLAATYGNREMRIYLDGGLVGTHTGIAAGPLWNSTQPLALGGADYSGNPYYLLGWLDEMRIYSVVLSPAQIDSAYNAFAPPTVTPVGIRNAAPGPQARRMVLESGRRVFIPATLSPSRPHLYDLEGKAARTRFVACPAGWCLEPATTAPSGVFLLK